MTKSKPVSNKIAFFSIAGSLGFILLLSQVNSAIPWANKTEMADLKAKYDHVIELKNQDNAWYRELDVTVSRLDERVKNIQEDIQEIKQMIRDGGQRGSY